MNIIMSEEDNIPPLPEYAAELEVELAVGKDLRLTPEEGIRVMEARIKGLEAELKAATDDDEAQRIAPQLNEARNRLAQYKLQLDGRN
jgi:predicted  nucleic acid-binding Zn-ribbon protein